MRCGSPPSAAIASRMAARSTTAGTPVKSCSSTRLVRNAISFSALPSRPTCASASMSARFTNASSSFRSRFSSRILRLKGSSAALTAGRLLERVEAEDGVRLAVDGQRRAAAEGVLACHGMFVSRLGRLCGADARVTDGATGGARTPSARLPENLANPGPLCRMGHAKRR